jgi:imidazolonepropionase-like amidohydrolase
MRTPRTTLLRLLLALVLVAATTLSAPGARVFAQAAGQSATTPPTVKAIRFGKLVDGTGRVLTNAVVLIEGDRIKSVSTSASSIPANAEVIDLSRYTGIPGMIDVHMHLTGTVGGVAGPNNGVGRVPNQVLLRSPVIDMFLSQGAARKVLETGVTTVRNLGSFGFTDIAMRDLINMGAMVGPRMFVSGPALRNSSALGVAVPEATADGPVEVARVVRRLIAAGVDTIKVFGSTRAGPAPLGMGQGLAVWSSSYAAFTYDELKAAVDTAHSLGKTVAVHSYGPDGARDAVRAGADSIEHGLDLDDATLADMARRGTFYVPTLYNFVYNGERNPQIKAQIDDFLNRTLETAKRAVRAGVKFAMGSDALAPNPMIGVNTRELGWLVKAGMTPEQALSAATTNAAALLGKEKELGMIAPGYFADLVAVEGDPLKDIDVAINNVRWVMKGGAVVFATTEPSKTN